MSYLPNSDVSGVDVRDNIHPIPPQELRKPNLRFIRTREKIPIDKSWQTINNFSYHHPNFINHVRDNSTYGVATGYGNLVVVDIDNEEVHNAIIQQKLFPETFTVKTAGKGFFHYYFFVEKPESSKIMDEDYNTVADIQGPGKQVIGPLSIINNKIYKVEHDVPIAEFTMQGIYDVMALLGYGPQVKKKEPQIEKEKPNKVKKEPTTDQRDNPVVNIIKSQVKISTLLNEFGISTSKNPTECPFHDSKGGKCLSFTEDLWHCFHCGKEGDLFHLYSEYHKCNFKTALEALSSRAGLTMMPGKKPSSNGQSEHEIIFNAKELAQAGPYLELNVKKVIIYRNKKESSQKFIFEDCEILLDVKDVTDCNAFRMAYYCETGHMLQKITIVVWTKILNYWTSTMGEFVNNAQKTNIEDLVKETIMHVIEDFTIVTDPKSAISYGRVYYDENHPDLILVSSKCLEIALKKYNFKISLGKLKVLLDDFAVGTTIQIRTGKAINRFWKFKKEMLPGLDFSILDKEEEE